MPPTTVLTSTTHFASAPVARLAQGEHLEADARLVVSPDTGVFEPAIDLATGAAVAAGQVVGHLTAGTRRVPVVSPFTGRAGDALAWSGERIATHQPVLWLSVSDGAP